MVSKAGVTNDELVEAERCASMARDLSDWTRPEFLDTLASVYAAAGDFGIATGYQRLAVAAAPDNLKSEFENRLASYTSSPVANNTTPQPTAR